MFAIAQANPPKILAGLLLVRHAVEILRQHHILHRGQEGNEMELLKDEANFFRAHPIEFVGRNASNVLPVEPDFSCTRSVQAPNQVHQG